MSPRSETPQAEHRRLLVALRQARNARHLTQKEVADTLDWSTSKLIRIEGGSVGISITDLRALLQHYEVTDPDEVDRMVEMARGSKKAMWWYEYRDAMPHEFYTFLGLEASAVKIKQFQCLMVPGLLQSRGYIETLVGFGAKPSERARRGLEVRLKRQELLSEDGPEFSFVLDESVLHRRVSSNAVMREQLLKLRDTADHPRMTIQILPFSAGIHTGMKSSFEILELSDKPDDYALFLGLPHKDQLIQRSSEETKDFGAMFTSLTELALPASETQRLIDQRLKEMEHEG